MRVKLIALTLFWVNLLSAQSSVPSSLPWSSLANFIFKELQQRYVDSIAYYQPKCNAVRDSLHELALSTGKDNSFMFGDELNLIKEGLSKRFLQKPEVLPIYKPGVPNKMADITNIHVRLFDLDVYLSHWLDAKMVLDRLGKQGLVGILKLDFEGQKEELGELKSAEEQRDWARYSIEQYMDHVLRNSPYFWAFKGDGTLRNDQYAQNLQLYQNHSTTTRKTNKQRPVQLPWLLPPVVDSIHDFSISSVNGDTLIKINNGRRTGVVNKQGKIVIPFSHNLIHFYSSYWIMGESRQKKLWYSRKGETFLHEYENVSSAGNGFVTVQKGQKWGMLDSLGKVFLPVVHDRYKMNERGHSIFYKGQDSTIYIPTPYRLGSAITTNTPSKYTPLVIPQRILDLKFDRTQEFDHYKGWYLVKKGNLVGLVDSLGQQVLPVEYNEIFRRGADLIYVYKNRQGGYWIISKNIKVEPKYKSLSPVGDSSMLAIVGNETGSGILDLTTDSLLFPYSSCEITYRKPYFLLTTQYDTTANRSSFDAIGYLHGLLNEKGQVIEKPDSVEIVTYFNGSYLIIPHYRERSTKYAVLKSDQGKVLRRFRGQYLTTHVAWIRHYDKTYDVHWVSYHQYKKSDTLEETHLLAEELCAVNKAGLWGFTNFRGQAIFPPIFTAVKDSKNGLICAKINGKWGILKNPLYKGNRR